MIETLESLLALINAYNIPKDAKLKKFVRNGELESYGFVWEDEDKQTKIITF
jgi:hypothetical protein